MTLPPICLHMNEERIVIADTLTNRTFTLDPHQADFQKKHPALYGVWAVAYGKREGGTK